MHDSLSLESAGNPVADLGHRFPHNDDYPVAERVRAALGTRSLNAAESALLAEIEDLARTVASTRAEIVAMGADDITASHIPCATDELDAIVTHTATATDSILESCEQLETLTGGMGAADAQILQDAVTRIYEACSFQDITGQRITKVVSALQAIERKVAHMIAVFSPDSANVRKDRDSSVPEPLMNGPQLSDAAMGQSDIDALLASFD